MIRINTITDLCREEISDSQPSILALSSSFSSDDDDDVERKKFLASSSIEIGCEDKSYAEEMGRRASRRQMSTSQEVWNAITMLVTPILGLFFILSGMWVTEEDVIRARESLFHEFSDSNNQIDLYFEGQERCLHSQVFPRLPAVPPVATLSIVLGYVLHSPCSIYYHLLCAFKIPPGPKRLDHWSRRLDQSMIHVMGTLVSYGTSGSIKYGLLSLAFTVDSIYRLFRPIHQPRGILIRMIIGFLMPVLPALVYGHFEEVIQFLIIYALSGWMFTTYPFGGYSHGFFHLIAALSNPIQLVLSTKLLTSQQAIQIAASCVVAAQSLFP
mmetsp:Transcript_5523/g.10511  ORF Transcript_5523/g.10511 Transcript_5523/m.10511 type:complete len:327 (-) Transcript_5523:4799-5779(-)